MLSLYVFEKNSAIFTDVSLHTEATKNFTFYEQIAFLKENKTFPSQSLSEVTVEQKRKSVTF